jgi:putative FmdB family regulatory protein
MPIYTYQCKECGLRFERSVKFSKRGEPIPCDACATPCDAVFPETVSGVFVKDVSGPVPQNTGLSAYDAHVDRVIGKSAAQGWAVQEQRVGDKKEFLRENPDATGYDLTQNPDGSWSKLTKDQRKFTERANTINSMAMAKLRPNSKPAEKRQDA